MSCLVDTNIFPHAAKSHIQNLLGHPILGKFPYMLHWLLAVRVRTTMNTTAPPVACQ